MKRFFFKVSKLTWERVFLNIEISSDYEGTAEFMLERIIVDAENRDEKNLVAGVHVQDSFPLTYKQQVGRKYIFECNITAMNDRQFLDNGYWRIIAEINNKKYICSVSNDVAYHFDQFSRVFHYGNGKYAYTISFDLLAEGDSYLWFVILSYFVKVNENWKKRFYIQEEVHIGKPVNGLYKRCAIIFANLFYQMVERVNPKHGDRLLIMSENKDYLSGNLKAIDDQLKERGLDKKFKISYSFRTAVGAHQGKFSWVRLIYLIAKQDYIFVDDYVPVFGFLNLNKNTKLVQVWHAGEGFKAVGYCRFGKAGTPYPTGTCHKKYDYVLTGSSKLIKVFSEVFGLEEEAFLPVGMPRLDGFLDENRMEIFRNDFYKKNSEWKNKKIILFAPTFRGTEKKTAYYNYEWIDLKEIYEFCADEFIFLVKMHPFVNEPIKIPEQYANRIIDYSRYTNINDLYYVTDLLITDYSSNYYEYSLMKRPVLFFTPDREIYELSRGVHRGVKECAPGKVCDSFDEMMTALRNKDFEVYKIYQFVEDNFSDYDGHATDKVIDLILLKQENNS